MSAMKIKHRYDKEFAHIRMITQEDPFSSSRYIVNVETRDKYVDDAFVMCGQDYTILTLASYDEEFNPIGKQEITVPITSDYVHIMPLKHEYDFIFLNFEAGIDVEFEEE